MKTQRKPIGSIVVVVLVIVALTTSSAFAWGPNLVQNPGFENGNQNWALSWGLADAAQEEPHSGSWSMKHSEGSPGDGAGREQSIDVGTLIPGETYILRGWGKHVGGGQPQVAWLACSWEDQWGQWTSGIEFPKSTTYVERQVEFTVSTVTEMKVTTWMGTSNGWAWYVDDVVLELKEEPGGGQLPPSPGDTDYYVSSSSGNDSWDGLTPATAWQGLWKLSNEYTYAPGDRIFLKAGDVFDGQQLFPRGSGSAAKPIIVDRYDTGADPVINGTGYDYVVRLLNSEYIEISNLELTDINSGTWPMTGVGIFGEDAGTLDHIYLNNLYIHDIQGIPELKTNGGIIAYAEGFATPTNFNDLRIENCTIDYAEGTGINVASTWCSRGQTTCNGNWFPSTNVLISNCIVNDLGRDGIILATAKDSLITNCVCSYANMRSGDAAAGIWTWNSDNVTIEYCESYATQTIIDGTGFDLDYELNDCVLQYSYSHDNEGGFLLLARAPGAGGFNNGSICRYCISENDADKIIYFGGGPTNSSIYNNVIYLDSTVSNPDILHWYDWGNTGLEPTGDLNNNIIYNTGNGTYNSLSNLNWDYNIFYGNHPASEPDDAHKITSDPMFVNPGSGGIGLNTVDGYQLQSGSPAIDSGVTIVGNGGLDYWGNTVPYSSTATDRGAYESSGGGSVCGDATCDPGEDQCNCAADCGTPPATETNCTDGIDEDCDGGADCADPTGDCDSDPACLSACNNNGTCETGEDCNNCSNDCISKTTGNPASHYCCGDGTCEGAEDSSNCAVDCGSGPFCGDGTCDPGEDNSNCPADCPPSACNNNSICEPGEDCNNCANDCDGVTGGNPANRYCCGNGTAEPPEGDGTICDGNY